MSTQSPRGVVIFDHVSKRYRLGALGTLRDTLAAMRATSNGDNPRRILWALRDVNFRVEPGKSLGLIGPNGAGKTTTLKLLSNVTRPTAGSVFTGGRTSSLIELGAGFHPELTGRENIYLNGAILGLKHNEITRKFDAIVDFSGLERFIETPVKRYSSGMYVRLAFAVAANVEADVLLVDEVLAVGDSEFRQKCLTRMDDLRRAGTTIIFVSHNMYQVRRICDQALLLMHGQPQFLGDTDQAISTYEKALHLVAEEKVTQEPISISDTPGALVVSSVEVLDDADHSVEQLSCDQPLVVKATYYTPQPLIDPIVKVRLIRPDGTVCAMTASRYQPDLNWTLVGSGVITTRFAPVQLVAGRYTVEVRIIDTTDSILLTSGQSAPFTVESPGFLSEWDRGYFVPQVSWKHEAKRLVLGDATAPGEA
jgi:ABC-type polysaccharide/polyol phosphate transport system ATPase subunit